MAQDMRTLFAATLQQQTTPNIVKEEASYSPSLIEESNHGFTGQTARIGIGALQPRSRAGRSSLGPRSSFGRASQEGAQAKVAAGALC